MFEFLSAHWLVGRFTTILLMNKDCKPTVVTYKIEPAIAGTRFTFEHTGFTGVGWVFHGEDSRRCSKEDA